MRDDLVGPLRSFFVEIARREHAQPVQDKKRHQACKDLFKPTADAVRKVLASAGITSKYDKLIPPSGDPESSCGQLLYYPPPSDKKIEDLLSSEVFTCDSLRKIGHGTTNSIFFLDGISFQTKIPFKDEPKPGDRHLGDPSLEHPDAGPLHASTVQILLLQFAERQIRKRARKGVFDLVIGGHMAKLVKDELVQLGEDYSVVTMTAKMSCDGFVNSYGTHGTTEMELNFVSVFATHLQHNCGGL